MLREPSKLEGDGMKVFVKDRLSVTEAAHALGLRSQSIYALLRDKVLPGEKLGTCWMIPAEEIERYRVRRRLRRVAGRRSFTSRTIDVTATTKEAVHTTA